MSSSDLESMFDLYRFRNQQDFHKILLYFPFGFVFLLLRLAVVIITFPVLALLPVSARQRSYMLKGICLAFGIKVKTVIRERDENAKLLICNHISILDHIVVESALTCKQINMCSHFTEWNFLALFPRYRRYSGNESDGQINILQHCFDGSGLSVCVFPERTTTNGMHGLLKFDPMLFDAVIPVQPVVIHISHTSFINISPSVLGSSAWCDLLWLLFVPYTEFNIRVLPSLVKLDNESAENFSKRVQATMALSLNILASDFTVSDKVAYEKRIAAGTISMNSIPRQTGNQVQRSEISKMATLVREILPDVPIAVILQDLGLTKSVDATIVRILEGKVSYIPESVPSSSKMLTKQRMSSDNNLSSNLQKQALLSLNTGVKSFGKTPKDRMLSYQERKAALIKSAKLRYLKKHGSSS